MTEGKTHHGRRHTEAELRDIARTYKKASNSGLPVQQAVADSLGVCVSTANKRVMAARQAGLIPKYDGRTPIAERSIIATLTYSYDGQYRRLTSVEFSVERGPMSSRLYKHFPHSKVDRYVRRNTPHGTKKASVRVQAGGKFSLTASAPKDSQLIPSK